MNLYDIVRQQADIENYIDFGHNGNNIEERVNHLIERSKYTSILYVLDMLAKAQSENEFDHTLLLMSYSQSITLADLCARFGWSLK